jgi:hypothetical protein
MEKLFSDVRVKLPEWASSGDGQKYVQQGILRENHCGYVCASHAHGGIWTKGVAYIELVDDDGGAATKKLHRIELTEYAQAQNNIL